MSSEVQAEWWPHLVGPKLSHPRGRGRFYPGEHGNELGHARCEAGTAAEDVLRVGGGI